MQEIILYNDANEKVKIKVLIQNETLWLLQAKIAELFGVQRPALSKHLKIFLIKANYWRKCLVPF
jgi:hypothetical protein